MSVSIETSGILEYAREAVDFALEAGATQAEATVSVSDRFSTEARDRTITKLEQSTGKSIHVRVFAGGRKATLVTSAFERGQLREAIAAAVAQARHVADDEFAGLPQPPSRHPLDQSDLELFSDEVAQRDPQIKIDE